MTDSKCEVRRRNSEKWGLSINAGYDRPGEKCASQVFLEINLWAIGNDNADDGPAAHQAKIKVSWQFGALVVDPDHGARASPTVLYWKSLSLDRNIGEDGR